MLDGFGLINMNGRVYDPVIARYLSPDNYVQSPTNSQGFNRYSYCLNNPLVYTDPDGNNPIIAAMIIGAIINVAVQGISGNLHSFGDVALAVGVGALAGAAGGLAGQAATQAITAAGGITGGFAGGAMIGANAGMAGGFVGGAGNAWANGASFNNGMYAGISGAGSGTVTGGLIGGISGAIRALSTPNSEFIDPSDSKFSFDGKGLTESEVEKFSLERLNVKEGDWYIRDITIEAPDGYRYDPNTHYFTKPGGAQTVDGVATRPNGWNGKTTVHFSTHSTQNLAYLEGVMIHEYTHAWQYYAGWHTKLSGTIGKNSREAAACNAQLGYFRSIQAPQKWIDGVINYKSGFAIPAPQYIWSPFEILYH